MKIEKVSENKLKVTLSNDDMLKLNITYDMLLQESKNLKFIFWEIIEIASKQTGIKFDNCSLTVEIFKKDKNMVILHITKKPLVAKTPIRYKIKRIKYCDNGSSFVRLFTFKEIDDFIKFAKSNLFFCFLLDGKNSLIRYNNELILEVCFKDEMMLYEKAFCDRISEYANQKRKNELFLNYIREHGRIILKKSALKMMYYKM